MRHIAVLMIVALLFIGVALASQKAPAGGPDDTKIDVGIYNDTGPSGNPINEQPKDDTVFTFHVTWTVTKNASVGGSLISSTTSEVGYFTSSQDNTGNYPTIYGKPYKITYYEGIYPLGTTIIEEGFYHIDHYQIPAGYCPQYPDGQDRKKSGTATENMKFYTWVACGELYPGFDGLFGTCNFPRRCYIRIQ